MEDKEREENLNNMREALHDLLSPPQAQTFQRLWDHFNRSMVLVLLSELSLRYSKDNPEQVLDKLVKSWAAQVNDLMDKDLTEQQIEYKIPEDILQNKRDHNKAEMQEMSNQALYLLKQAVSKMGKGNL